MMGSVGAGGGGGSASAARVLGAGRALLWRMLQQHQSLGARRAGVATSTPAALAEPSAPAAASAAAATAADANAASSQPVNSKSLDAREARKFGALADKWWDVEGGPFAPLHAMNPVRVAFIRDAVLFEGRSEASAAARQGAGSPSSSSSAAEPLAGLRILDVGCGGGILSEPLARLGARVLGIDAAREGVEAARAHAALDPRVAARTRYRAATAEQLLAELTQARAGAAAAAAGKEGEDDAAAAAADDDDDAQQRPPPCRDPFDVVVASEVIEHVRDPAGFLATLAALARPRTGQVVISTLNRTPAALALAVVGAERVAGIVPPGTQDWHRFLTPQELAMLAEQAGLEVSMMAGMVPDLGAGARALAQAATGRYGGGGLVSASSSSLSLLGSLLGNWRLSSTDLRINYIALLQRKD